MPQFTLWLEVLHRKQATWPQPLSNLHVLHSWANESYSAHPVSPSWWFLCSLSYFCISGVQLSVMAWCHSGHTSMWTKRTWEKLLAVYFFFIGLVEGFLFVFVWFLFVFSWVYLRKNKYKKIFRFLKRNVWLLLLKEIHKMKVYSFTFFSSLLSQ